MDPHLHETARAIARVAGGRTRGTIVIAMAGTPAAAMVGSSLAQGKVELAV